MEMGLAAVPSCGCVVSYPIPGRFILCLVEVGVAPRNFSRGPFTREVHSVFEDHMFPQPLVATREPNVLYENKPTLTLCCSWFVQALHFLLARGDKTPSVQFTPKTTCSLGDNGEFGCVAAGLPELGAC